MSEIEIAGTLFNFRPLKRKETKKLRRDGLLIRNLPALFEKDPDKLDELMDRVFDCMFSKDEIAQIDEMSERQAGELFTAIYKETYGAPDEEKNLLPSGNGAQTETESTTASGASPAKKAKK